MGTKTRFFEKEIRLSYAVAVASVVFLGNLAVSLFLKDVRQRMVLSDILAPLLNLLATLALFYAAWRSRTYSRRTAYAWTIFAIGQLAFTIGDIIYGVFEVGLNQTPFPSFADVFYLAYDVFFLVAVEALPSSKFSKRDIIKIILDICVVILAAILTFWNFLIGPIAFIDVQNQPFSHILALAYPIGDLLLFWALLVLLYWRPGGKNQAPLRLMAASAATVIASDIIFSYQNYNGTYVSGGLLEAVATVPYLLSALAGIFQASPVKTAKKAESETKPELKQTQAAWVTYIPYFWLCVSYLLLMWEEYHHLPMDRNLLVLWIGGIIVLVLVRQILTMNENRLLSEKLYEVLIQEQQQAKKLSEVNQDLQAEIERRKHVEEKLVYDALHDPLTGLPNRVLFIDRLQHALEILKRRSDYIFAVFFLDLDHFKSVNDSMGHEKGDQFLIEVTSKFKSCLRASDTVARFGGDEFAFLLDSIGDVDAQSIAERIQYELARPVDLDGRNVSVSASIGIVLSAGYTSPIDILRDADIAMYHAKSLGKARYHLFDASMRTLLVERMEMERDLRRALEYFEFRLYYQPIFSLQTNRIVGFEALLRWLHPKKGLIMPLDFIPIAEETGLIVPMGYWVLHEACLQLHEWHTQFRTNVHLTINVNVSSRQFEDANLVDQIERTLFETGLQASYLRLEITESVLLESSHTTPVLAKLNRMGVRLLVDDFGVGYSSLSYLHNFPFSTVKIDRTFVSGIGTSSTNNLKIVRTILNLADEMGMDAIAEGIETQAQLENLKELKCGYGQGFLFAKPLEREATEAMIMKNLELDSESGVEPGRIGKER